MLDRRTFIGSTLAAVIGVATQVQKGLTNGELLEPLEPLKIGRDQWVV